MKNLPKLSLLIICLTLLSIVITVHAAPVNTSVNPAPVLLWWASTGTAETESYEAAKVASSGDGNYIAAGYGAGIVEFRDRQGALLWKWQSLNSAYTVWQVAVSQNGEHTGILLYDPYQNNMGELDYFDRVGNLLWSKPLRGPFGFESLSGDGDVVALADNSRISFLNATGQVTGMVPLDGFPWTIAVSDDGSAAVAGTDALTKPGVLYAARTNGTILWSSPDRHGMRDVAISDDGRFVAGAGLNELRYFTIGGDRLWSFNSSPEFSGVAMSSDGTYVAVTSQYYLRFFNATGSKLWQYEISSFPTRGGPSVGSLVMSSDGYLSVTSEGGRILFFNPEGKILWETTSPHGVVSTSLSRNGKYLVVGTMHEINYFDTGIDVPVAEPEPTIVATTEPLPTPSSTPQASVPGILGIAGICAGILLWGKIKQKN